jgi:hypothetical protein
MGTDLGVSAVYDAHCLGPSNHGIVVSITARCMDVCPISVLYDAACHRLYDGMIPLPKKPTAFDIHSL